MLRFLAVLFTGVIVSFYYFPFEFSFLPGLNTKMGLAVIGIFLAVLTLIRKREMKSPPNLVRIEALAVLVSVVGFVAVIANNTPDYAYATYFVSMTVWLSGAYAVCSLIKAVHKELTVDKVTIYITCVCVAQCILALIIDSNLLVKTIVDTYIMQDQSFLNEVERLYGIGASLDTAGVRFSACLLLLTSLINRNKHQMTNRVLLISVIAFVLISVIGNMIARTTIVGVLLSLIYALCAFRLTRVSYGFLYLVRVILLVLLVAIPLSVHLYNNNPQFHQLSRFAFEGFFSLVETGEWEIDSNEKLKAMMVFPDNVKTWIIGDGYFANPYNTDPTYVGYQPGGYYMGTDIGYCRFIFYFGLIGLFVFSCFLILVAKECIALLPDYTMVILFILLLGFIIWLKVATDVFLVFALLLCIGNLQDAPENSKLNYENSLYYSSNI